MLPLLRETPPRHPQPVIDEASVTAAEARAAASGLPDDDPWTLDLWLRVIGLGVVMGLFLSYVGALGTHEAPFLRRIGYWEILMVGGSLLAVGVNYVVRVRFMPKVRVLWQDVVTVLLAPVFISGFVLGVSPLYWGYNWHVRGLWGVTSAVFVITLIMTFLHYLLVRKPHQSHAFAPVVQATENAASVAPVITFYERLPARFQNTEIRALSAEDHYLRVHTPVGETLILMRLYDAIRELEGIEGSQTHRSWWVARSAILEVVRRDGRVSLRLEGGLHVPVSRSYQKALKQDGWL